jgi:hypothetical protein
LDDEGGVQHRRQGRQIALPRLVDARHECVGGAACRAALQRLGGEPPQVLDQRQPQRARPRPQLADGERGDRLEAGEEADQLRTVEPAVAVADELDRQRVDARGARQLAGGQPGQLAVVAARQVLADAADLRGDEVEVVEDPLGGGGDGLAATDVARQRPVGPVEEPGVVVQPPIGAVVAAAGAGIEGEARRQRLGPLLELLDAGELVAQRPVELRRPPAQERREERAAGRVGQRSGLRTRARERGGSITTIHGRAAVTEGLAPPSSFS